MKKTIHALYAICFIFFIALAAYMLLTFQNDRTEVRHDDGFQILTEYESAWVPDESLPCGGKDTIRIRLDEMPVASSSIIFFSIHQNVNVYLNDTLLFQQRVSEQNRFGTTPGNLWNSIPIYQEDCGKELRIELIPAYDSSIGKVPEIYFGSQFDIYKSVIRKDALGLLLGMLAVVFGLIFCIYSIRNYRNPQADRSLLVLGIFAVNIGAWKLADAEAFSLLVPLQPASSYFTFFALMLSTMPFALFIKNLFTKKEKPIWDIYCVASLCSILLCTVLQFTKYKDFRQTLLITHLMMLILVIIFLYEMIRERRSNGWNTWLKLTAVWMALGLLGMSIDIGTFYFSARSATRVLGMTCFLSYIISLGIMKMKENQRLLAMGRKATHLEKMAFHDPLTGLYNRAAYVEDIGGEAFCPKDYIVAMFDLNNLKLCNDTLGHDAGDRYLTASAGFISKNFEDIGKCYRMGGDEFCVLMEGTTVEECRIRAAELKSQAEQYNEQHPEEFAMQIACGYKHYSEELDYDIGDTLRRADKMMYHEKLMMKLNEDQPAAVQKDEVK